MDPDYTENNDPNSLLTLNEDGSVPESRLSSPASANDLAQNLWLSDQAAAYDRAMVDGLNEGTFSPQSQGDLRSEGQGNSANVNFLGAMGREDTALAAYNNLSSQTEFLINCQIDAAPPETKAEKAQIFAEEFTYLNRFCWPDFVPNMLYLAKFFIRHGVTFAFKDNEWDWRYKVSRIGNFQVQRREGCSVDDVELAVQRTFYSPSDVYDWIRNAKAAEAVGWNVSATKEAIKNATVPLYTGVNNSGADWEQWERDAKNNSMLWTQGKAKQVEFRHFWVKEFDGTVSHKITSPDNDEEFLFEHKARFDSTTDCFCFFTYGIGNGDLYSIRGLGWKLFGSEQALNVVKNKMVDCTMISMSHVFQAKDGNAQEDMSSVTWGAMTVIPPDFEYKDNVVVDLTNNAIPMINMLSAQQASNTGTYVASPDQQGPDVEKTKAQYLGEAAQQAVLTTSAMDLYYQALDRLYQMQVKSLIKDPYPKTMPGGPERWQFFARLMKRGLSMEEIKSVTAVRAVRAVGAGSEALKSAKLNQFLEVAQQMGPEAQRAALRMAGADLIGYDALNAIYPRKADLVPDDKKVAEIETSLFFNGITPEVMPNEIDSVHIPEHFTAIQGMFSRLQNGSIQPKDAIDSIGAASQHCHAHIQKMQQGISPKSNGPNVQLVKQFNVQLQQFDAQLQKLIQNVQQGQQAQQSEQAQAQQQNSTEALNQQREDAAFKAEQARKDAQTQAAIKRDDVKAASHIQISHAKANQHLQSGVAKTAATIQSTAAKTKQDLAVNDVKTAQEVEIERAKTNQELHHKNLHAAADLEKKAVDNANSEP